MIGDVFQVSDLGKGPQLHAAMSKIEEIGYGAVVFINKLHQGGGFAEELLAYARYSKKQEKSGVFHPFDSKDYGIGAQIVRDLGIRNINLLSDSPKKSGDIGYVLQIISHTSLAKSSLCIHLCIKKPASMGRLLILDQKRSLRLSRFLRAICFLRLLSIFLKFTVLLAELIYSTGSINKLRLSCIKGV